MRVCLVTYWYPNRDNPEEGRFIQEQAVSIARYVDLSVVAVDPCIQFMSTEVSFEKGIPTVRVGLPDFPRHRRALLAQMCFLRGFQEAVRLVGEPPDVLHAVILPASLAGVYLARRNGIPLVITEHSSTVGRTALSRLERTLVRTIYERATTVVAVSNLLSRAVNRVSPRALCEVIPNAINIEEIPDVRKDSKARTRFLFVGALIADKGILDLLSAMLLLEENPYGDIELDIVGSGPQRDEVEAFVRSHHMRGIRILGQKRHDEVIKLMCEAKTLVLPSKYETFGVVAIEAVACGAMVVGTNVGVLKELADQGYARTCEPGDVQGLAELMLATLNDSTATSSQGRAFVEARYGSLVVGNSYRSLYNRILERSRSTRK